MEPANKKIGFSEARRGWPEKEKKTGEPVDRFWYHDLIVQIADF